MNNLWRKICVCLLLCGSAIVTHYSLTKKTTEANELPRKSISELISLNDGSGEKRKSLLANQTQSFCQSIGTDYQEFYNFQTRNYNISICLKGEEWFYYRESKSNPDNALLLPATVVFGGDVFKAVDKKTTYFVGINSDGYYSSVMYGNDQMIFEPALSGIPAIANREENVASVAVSNPETADLQNSELNTSYWKVCTEDREDLHPYLNGWQKFIGESPKTISDYASIKGHSFSYSDAETENALVETTDGLMVSLDIVQMTETISSICVKPIASF